MDSIERTAVKSIKDLLVDGEVAPPTSWQLKVVMSDDCMSYVAWNQDTREVLYIDPKLDDMPAYLSTQDRFHEFICLGVIDTHTHADHISGAAELARTLKVPLMMHALSASQRVHLRVAQFTSIVTRAGILQVIPTPGHTPDSMCVTWGPFAFTGDTVLFGDVGRDDLPGGDPRAHFESLEILKKTLKPEVLILPGHDHKGGRISSWSTQLRSNSSLTQGKEDFIQESASFDAAAPKLLKKALFENLK